MEKHTKEWYIHKLITVLEEYRREVLSKGEHITSLPMYTEVYANMKEPGRYIPRQVCAYWELPVTNANRFDSIRNTMILVDDMVRSVLGKCPTGGATYVASMVAYSPNISDKPFIGDNKFILHRPLPSGCLLVELGYIETTISNTLLWRALCPYASMENKGLVAFTQNLDKWKRDIQTPMKFGKFLRTHFGPSVTSSQIETYANWFLSKYTIDEDLFEILTDPMDIVRAYTDGGESSCMSYNEGDWYQGMHPCQAYGAPGNTGLAVLWQDSTKRRVKARAVVQVENKQYSSAYGDYHKLHFLLESKGYTNGIDDAILNAVEIEANVYCLPYIDFCDSVSLVREEDTGKLKLIQSDSSLVYNYSVIRTYGTKTTCGNSDGIEASLCAWCEERPVNENTCDFDHRGNPICGTCRSDDGFECVECCEIYMVDDSAYITGSDRELIDLYGDVCYNCEHYVRERIEEERERLAQEELDEQEEEEVQVA